MVLEQFKQLRKQSEINEDIATRYPESLVVTLRAFAHHDSKIHLMEEKEEKPPVICSDGYVRQSPVQPLLIPPAAQKRRQKILMGLCIGAGIGIGILICAVVIVIATVLL